MDINELSVYVLPFLLAILLLKLGTTLKNNYSTSNLPPGPWKLPLIGNIHQLLGSLPHRAMRDLAKKYGPLMHLQVGEMSTIVISSPETAKEVMKTHDIIFASRPHTIASKILFYNSTNLAFAPYGEYWRQLRKLCTLELLSSKRVQSLRYVREEETENLISWLACNEGKAINLTQKIYSSLYSVTSRAALGKKSEEQEAFIDIITCYLLGLDD